MRAMCILVRSGLIPLATLMRMPGDEGFFDTDGALYVTDRIKELYVSGRPSLLTV
jgi:hypothetical protein